MDECEFISLNQGWPGKSYFILSRRRGCSGKLTQIQPVTWVGINERTSSSLRAVWKAEDKDKVHTFKCASLS